MQKSGNVIASFFKPVAACYLLLACAAWSAEEETAPQLFLFQPESSSENGLQQFMRRGEKAMEDGIFQEAIANFRQYLQKIGQHEPEYAAITGKLAEAYMASGQLGEAEQVLDEHQHYCSVQHDAEIENWLCYLKGQLLFRKQAWEDCLKQLDDVLAQPSGAPWRIQTVILAADAAGQRRDWPMAEGLTKREIPGWNADSHEFFQLLPRLLNALIAQKKYSEALAFSKDVHSPDELEERSLQICRILAMAGLAELDEALALYESIAVGCPSKPDEEWWNMLWFLGEALFAARRLEACETVYGQALTVTGHDEDKISCLLRLADVRSADKRPAAAAQALEEVCKLYPKCSRIYQVTMRLAVLKRELGESMRAAELLGEMMNLPSLPVEQRLEAALQKADCLVKNGACAEAVKTYQGAAALAGNNIEKGAELLMLAAQTARNGNDFDAAVEIYARVPELYAAAKSGTTALLECGKVYFEQKKYAEARQALGAFMTAHPEHSKVWEARLQAGMAYGKIASSDAEKRQAVEELKHLALDCPEEPVSVQASIEACRYAEAWMYFDEALDILAAVPERYPANPQLMMIHFRRILLEFKMGEGHVEGQDRGLEHARKFLEQYGKDPKTAQILMLLGDYYVSMGDYAEAQACYSRIRPPDYDGDVMMLAIYETAVCAFSQGNQELALALLGRLAEEGTQRASQARTDNSRLDMLLAKGMMLKGEIFSTQGKYDEAKDSFVVARIYGGDSDLGFAALGRQADMLLELSVTKPELLDKAIDCLKEILTAFSAEGEEGTARRNPALCEMACYRLGKCYEAKGEPKKAIGCYEKIYLEFGADRDAGKARDWHYYYRSVFDLAHLLELEGDLDSLRLAARAYEDLARTSLPRSKEAAEKARMIRQTHGLGNGD